MAEHRTRQDFLRLNDSYNTATLSAYARDILTRSIIHEGARPEQSFDAKRHLKDIGTTLELKSDTLDSNEQKFELYTKYSAQAGDYIKVYYFNSDQQYVEVSETLGAPRRSDEPLFDTMNAMKLLRLGWPLLEPQGNLVQAIEFSSIMANIALDSFNADNRVIMSSILNSTGDMQHELKEFAADSALNQGLDMSPNEGKPTYPYTYNKTIIKIELNKRINRLLYDRKNAT